MGKHLKRSRTALGPKPTRKVVKSEKETEKAVVSEKVALSRGRRRRQYARERKEGFVAFLAKASAKRENLAKHGEALGDMGKLTSALTEMQQEHNLEQDLKALASLKGELGMKTMNKRQAERATEIAKRLFWQRLDGDTEFNSDPVAYTLAVCRKAAATREKKLQVYKSLKDSVSSRG